MTGETRLQTIGELARLTGLTVKTIRFWSDAGLVPPDGRTPTGYRLYGETAALRLGLVRTLRDLGVDLATIRRVLEREASVAEVAGVHAAALDVRIRELQRQRAVLHRVAGRGTVTAEEIELMHRLAQLSGAERRRLVNDFIDETFAGLDLGPDFLPMLRGAMPDLPDEPAQEQVDAWVELAELTQDPDFRTSLRRAAIDQAQAHAEAGQPDPEAQEATVALLRDRVGAAADAGIPPDSAEGRKIVDEVAAEWARHVGRTDGPEFRAWLADRIEASGDRRYERYWELLAVINGWERAPGIMTAAQWLLAGLRAG
jgi:DNA-binding transcriptional MerR regulator